ncbi:hypothetical protein ACSFA8_19120 [Variovorax sp. RT4R15]|uniref:hypothetical protein n=1 Tax=Variovorax sp. RT4R15 TaxID=3443737 RepID=UPI003F45CD5B
MSAPKMILSGGTASNDFFGGDPAPMTPGKAVYSLGPVIPDPRVQVPDPTPMPKGDAITSIAGAVLSDRYKAMADKLHTAEGMAYLKGLPSTLASVPTYKESAHTRFTKAQQIPAGETDRTTWEKGGPAVDDSGNYYSNTANAIFDADDANHPGVNNFQMTAGGNASFTTAPQISWIDAEGERDGNMRSAAPWHGPLNPRKPIAMSHAFGRPGWNMQSMVVFADGLIANARGMNNAQNAAADRLKSGLVPTDIYVTNSSEFALVTCWDKVNVKGVLAIVALAGMPNGYTRNGMENLDDYWGDWKQLYPGLQNLGNWAFAKVVGYLDLPDMKAPTGVFASTGVHPYNGYGGLEPQREKLNLDNAADRARFADGGTHERGIAKVGVAVVISKSERKAIFIDLKPLFAYYRKMYFGTEANYAKTKTKGNAAGQWPLTFIEAPEQIPIVLKTVTFSNPPTVVRMTLWSPYAAQGQKPRAWIATEEGTIHTYEMASWTPTAAQIVNTGFKVRTGANPVYLGYIRSTINVAGATEFSEKLLVVSRARRSVQWVNLYTGKIEREFQDSRVVDPVGVDDSEANGSFVPVMSIADYTGRAVHNVQYGVIEGNPQFGVCQPGTNMTNARCYPAAVSGRRADFEYSGKLAVPGKVRAVLGSNVP